MNIDNFFSEFATEALAGFISNHNANLKELFVENVWHPKQELARRED